MLFKNTMEIACVVVTGQGNDIFYRQPCFGKKVGSLIQTFYLKQFLKGFPRPVLDLPAEPVQVIVQRIGNFGQTGAAVVFLNIA